MSSSWHIIPRDILSKVFARSSSLSCIARQVCKAWRQQSIACPLVLNVSLVTPEEQKSLGIWMQQCFYATTSAVLAQQTVSVPASPQTIERLDLSKVSAVTVSQTPIARWPDPPADLFPEPAGRCMTKASRDTRRLDMDQPATASTISQTPWPDPPADLFWEPAGRSTMESSTNTRQSGADQPQPQPQQHSAAHLQQTAPFLPLFQILLLNGGTEGSITCHVKARLCNLTFAMRHCSASAA